MLVKVKVFLFVIIKTTWRVSDVAPRDTTTTEIGKLLMTDYVLPFEVASVLLLVALIGAAMLASREGEEEEGEL